MGNRATVIIGVAKDAYVTTCLLTGGLPKLLQETPKIVGTAVYWRFEGYRWETSDPDVAAVYEFFQRLDDLAYDNEVTGPQYGGVELWDEGMNESFGDPSEFGIWVIQHIESPLDEPKQPCTPATT